MVGELLDLDYRQFLALLLPLVLVYFEQVVILGLKRSLSNLLLFLLLPQGLLLRHLSLLAEGQGAAQVT